MQKVLVGLGVVVLVAAVTAGIYLWSGRGDNGQSHASTTAGVTGEPADPFGRTIDKKDPGEVHFRQGRYPEAIAYWTEQAAKGNAYAAYRLGVEYMDAKPGVVQRDYGKAMQYHRQAAVAGIPLSMFDVGSMFEYGQGVTKDIAQSASWYGHSARYGLAQGQYNFATMLEAGEGVAKDEVEALKFFILAARSGFTGVPYDNEKLLIDRDAPTPTQLLERRLSREQIAEGRQRADTFKVSTGPLNIE
ncbi:MAG: tetratricopeptide repeat protein [Alphaproteobacteria bacterium]|jgi:TPR repeat protein|nr:tetratricopeptide repeat protein [Alphaproteobacteria bacterium]